MATRKPCIECHARPKWGTRHRCRVCYVRSLGITERVAESRRRAGMVPEALARRVVPARLWPPGTRWCAGCQTFVDLEDVAKGATQCRPCSSSKAHAARTEKVYGLTIERYDELLELQGGKCAICRNRPKKKRLAVDHDHVTGAVRGLLCSRCNHDLLGAGWDSVNVLRAAVSYLEANPASGLWQAPESGPRISRPTPESVDPFVSPGDRNVEPVSDGSIECSLPHYLPTGAVRAADGTQWRVYVGDDDPPPF